MIVLTLDHAPNIVFIIRNIVPEIGTNVKITVALMIQRVSPGVRFEMLCLP